MVRVLYSMPVASTDSAEGRRVGEAGRLLNSWKEIAAYLGRGVRTVQRWERDLRLPVRRPKGHERGAVIAFAEELDTWLHETPMRSQAEPPVAEHRHDGPPSARALAPPRAGQEELWRQSRTLRQLSRKVREDHISTRLRNRDLRHTVHKLVLQFTASKQRGTIS